MARRELRFDLTSDTRDFTRGVNQADREVGKLGKSGDKTWGQLKKGATLAGAAVVGGLVVGLKKSADAAIEAEKVQARLQAQLKASGISYSDNAKMIDQVIQKTSQLSGLDDEDLTDAFTNIVRTTGDVTQSLKLTGLAADFARAKHMDVAKAGEIVAKVAGGNTGILSRYGVTIDKNATSTEALAALQQKFAGQAKGYGETTAGSLDRMNVAAENLAENVGEALAPAIAGVADDISKFVDEMQTGEGAGGKFAATAKKIAGALADVGGYLKDHKALLVGAAAAWGIYKTASLIALAAIKVDNFKKMFGLGKGVAATQGAVAGTAYAGAFNATSSTGVAGPLRASGGKKGFLGRAAMVAGAAAGPLMAAAMVGAFVYAYRREINAAADDIQDELNKILPGFLQSDVNREGDGLDDFIDEKIRKPIKVKLPKASPNEGKGFKASASTFASASRVPSIDAGSRRSSAGAVPKGGVSGGKGGGGGLALQSYICRTFSLRATGGYRTPDRNAAVNGADNSWHMRGSASNPGAIDQVGAMGNMQAASAWAAENVPGLAENMIHDAGSGMHLHLAGNGVMNWNGGGGSSSPGAGALGAPSIGGFTSASVAKVAVKPKIKVGTAGGSTAGGPGIVSGFAPGSAPWLDAAKAQADVDLHGAIGDPSKAAGIWAALGRLVKVRIAKIQAALKGKLSPAKRTELLSELAGLLGYVGEIDSNVHQLLNPPVELNAAGGTFLGAVGRDPLPFSPEPESESLKDLIRALQDEVKRGNDMRERIATTQYGVLANAVADVASGVLGGNAGLGFATPSFPGGRVRY